MGAFYVEYEYWIAAFQLATAMLGMGATLRLKDFRDLALTPMPVALGLVVQLVAVPVMAFLFLRLLGVQDGVAVGIAIIAAIPGGTISNIFTFLARGNITLSISITGLTTIACLLTTPLILGLLMQDNLPADFAMPTGEIVNDILFILLLPLALGMLYLFMYPNSAPNFSKWCIRASLFGILLIVLGSLAAGRVDLVAYGIDNIILLVLFTLLLAGTAWLTPVLMRLNRPDASAVGFEVVIRNVNLGVMLKATMFPAAAASQLGDTVLFTLLFYGGLMFAVAPLFLWLYKRGDRERPNSA
ncbi:MAG: bile acid:sodium symporter [Pseudomonadota bacterium]